MNTRSLQLQSLIPFENQFANFVRETCTSQDWSALRELSNTLREGDEPSDEDLETMLLQIGKELKSAGKIDSIPKAFDADAIEKGEDGAIVEHKTIITEGLFTILAAAPTLVKLLGKMVDWVIRKFTLSKEEQEAFKEKGKAIKVAKKTGKYNGKDISKHDLHELEKELQNSKAGKVLVKVSHALHKLYVSPLRIVLAGITFMATETSWKDAWKKSKIPANVLYAIIVIVIAGHAAYDVLSNLSSTLQHAGGFEHIADVVIEAVEGGDLGAAAWSEMLGAIDFGG